MDLKEETILGDSVQNHWYYVAKSRAMQRFLGNIKVPEVLDIGAGSGIFSRKLIDYQLCDSAVCLDSNYLCDKQENYHGKTIDFIRSIEQITQKLVLMMDVLEHVPDDKAFLRQYVEKMTPGTSLLITVPAFQFLWSGHDVFLGHYRRYNYNRIVELVKNAGMVPVKSRYFFGSIFPIVAAIRISKDIMLKRGIVKAQSDLKAYPTWLNNILIRTHDLERQTFFDFNRFMGLSLFCLCRKP